MVNEPISKIRPCGHTVTCGGCTKALMELGDPFPFCRKAIVGFELGKWSSVIGAAGLWPASLKNLSELASGEGFNEYFQKLFVGNEASYLRWKEVFDVLGVGVKGGGGSIETQVLGITNSEDLVKLRALAKLCSQEFFDDPSLLVVALRRIMEVLETKVHPRTLLTVENISIVYHNTENYGKAEELYQRALEGKEAQFGKDHEDTMRCARRFSISLKESGNSKRLAELKEAYPRL